MTKKRKNEEWLAITAEIPVLAVTSKLSERWLGFMIGSFALGTLILLLIVAACLIRSDSISRHNFTSEKATGAQIKLLDGRDIDDLA
ncbi:hypothetical protein [Paenibacillus polymyxa]|uniref:hypothetical protein n=1 Tax=Paenibacillus polymyxa TaxID=1406 RepID=UPI002AB477BE|nr:hypothetical protein [Paenibacillus polymyxa]MDY8026262.1 hypothetical protein [Paenibacillus polymyxa]